MARQCSLPGNITVIAPVIDGIALSPEHLAMGRIKPVIVWFPMMRTL